VCSNGLTRNLYATDISIAEVNSLKFRTKGAALATAMDWYGSIRMIQIGHSLLIILTIIPRLFNYVVVQSTPVGIQHLRWGLYLIYAVFNAAFVPLVYFLVVETGGRSLEETDRWFERNKGWLVHRADHSVDGSGLKMNGRSLNDFQISDAHDAMMRSFEIGADNEDDDSVVSGSPVTRRDSYPMVE